MPGVVQGTLDSQLANSAAARDWATITAWILATSPEMQGACARLARARANVDRQQSQAIPNLSLLVGAGLDNGTTSGMLNTRSVLLSECIERLCDRIAITICRQLQQPFT